jgi:Tfp pilus assembly protein PilF
VAGNQIETNGSSVTLSGAVSSNRKKQNAISGRRATKGRNPLVGPVLALMAGLALIVTFAAPWKRSAPVGSHPSPSTKPPPAGAQPTFTAVEPNSLPADQDVSDTDKAAWLMNRGTEFFQQGMYQDAATNYVAAIKLTPEDETAHFNLGLAMVRLGKPAEAKQAYLEALRLFPDYAEAHNSLGNLLASQGQLVEAVEHLTTALTLTPESASVHNNFGTLLIRQGKLDQALTNFAEAVRLMPEYVEARCNLGQAYLSQGKPYEAAAEFQEALRLKPGFEPARRGMARLTQQRPAPLAPIPLKP